MGLCYRTEDQETGPWTGCERSADGTGEYTYLATGMAHGMYITFVGIQPNSFIGLQKDQTMGHARERYLL